MFLKRSRFGWWKGVRGWLREHRRVFGRVIYEYRADEAAPLTFTDPQLVEWRPDRHFYSDRLSKPVLLPWPNREAWLPAVTLHDSAYCFHHLWRRRYGEDAFTPVPLTRAEADRMLRLGILADGGSAAAAAIVYRMVRCFGGRGWAMQHALPEPVTGRPYVCGLPASAAPAEMPADPLSTLRSLGLGVLVAAGILGWIWIGICVRYTL